MAAATLSISRCFYTDSMICFAYSKGIQARCSCSQFPILNNHQFQPSQLLHPIILTEADMVQLSSAIAALALAVSSVEALALAAPSFELRCYGLNGPSQDSTSFSSWAGEGRSEERNHVKNMCKGYSDGNGYHRGAL
jgi:hypothetical protein